MTKKFSIINICNSILLSLALFVTIDDTKTAFMFAVPVLIASIVFVLVSGRRNGNGYTN